MVEMGFDVVIWFFCISFLVESWFSMVFGEVKAAKPFPYGGITELELDVKVVCMMAT